MLKIKNFETKRYSTGQWPDHSPAVNEEEVGKWLEELRERGGEIVYFKQSITGHVSDLVALLTFIYKER